jgi:hypothetical protein
MAQATDGNWYAYFADRNQAIIAANTAAVTGKGLNFGAFCNPTSTFSPKTGVTYTETDGFTLARGGFGSVNHTSAFTITSSNFGVCTNVQGILTTNQMEHVVRQNKTLNSNPLGFNANSGTYPSVWPVIQLYDFSAIPSTVIVDYQKNGGDQTVNLVFDRIPGNIIKGVANRPDFPQGAQVQADLIDPQLNVDPTEEDSWTWGTSTTNNTVFYQTFSRNGQPDADGTRGMQDLSGNLTTMMFNHNGRLTTIPRPQGVQVVEAQNNGIQKVFQDNNGKYRTSSISGASGPITLLEIQPNVGIFSDYDAGGIADLKILDNAKRDTSFIAKYNDVSYSLVVKFHSAELTMGIPISHSTNIQNTGQVISSQMEEKPNFISFLKGYVLKNLLLLF